MSPVEGGRTGIHATAVVHGECGVLICGPSGSGKSALALALLARARDAGAFGTLIGDDRIWTRPVGGRLLASGSPRLAGLVERRGAGLVAAPHQPAALVALVVELSKRGRTWPRLPDEPDLATVEGIGLPRLALDSRLSSVDQAVAVEERLGIIQAAREKEFRLNIAPQCTKMAGFRLATRSDERRELEPGD